MRFLPTTTFAVALPGQATALYIEKTCQNITLDPETEILSANCDDEKGVSHPNSFDLNTCLGWNSNDVAITYVRTFHSDLIVRRACRMGASCSLSNGLSMNN